MNSSTVVKSTTYVLNLEIKYRTIQYMNTNTFQYTIQQQNWTNIPTH